MPEEINDPRRLDSDGIAGPADPHGRDDHLIDARHAVLLEEVTASMITEGNRGRLLAALVLGGRINQTQDRARVLFVLNADAVASIVSELVGLLGRAGFGTEVHAALVERLNEMEAEGLLRPKEETGDAS